MGQGFNLSLDFYREFPVITQGNLDDREGMRTFIWTF